MTDETRTPEPDATESPGGCAPPLWLVGVAFVVVIAAGIFGLQLLGIVWGLIFPPDAPRPPDAVEISYEDLIGDAEQWRYTTDLTPCEVVSFYEAAGGTCTYAVHSCAEGYQSPVFEVDYFAECTAIQTFSIFALRWQVSILPQYTDAPGPSTFDLVKEMLWGGPPADEPEPDA
jgi:hypothetical protein